MKSLVDLIRFKRTFETCLAQLKLDKDISDEQRNVNAVHAEYTISDYDSDFYNISNSYNELLLGRARITEELTKLVEKITFDIENTGREISQLLVDQGSLKDKIIPLDLPTNADIDQFLFTRISGYADWKYPGLLLNFIYSPHYDLTKPQPVIDSMVALDPLYLVGKDTSILINSTKCYPGIYQNRIRFYEIADPEFSILPQAQFGFVLCWNFLNHQPVDQIELYLKNIFNLLRPGGVLMFSYNNGHIESVAGIVDHRQLYWCSKTIINDLATAIGYEVIKFTDMEVGDDLKSWTSSAELKRPGQLSTAKRSQSMGKIQKK